MNNKVFSFLVLFSIPGLGFAGSITCRGTHYYPSNEELHFALAAASIGDESVRSRILGDGRLHLTTCASELRSKICNDGMIMGIFDKKASIAGGAAGFVLGGGLSRNGSATNAVSSGALFGSAIGAVAGMSTFTKCNKKLAEISTIANRIQRLPHGSDANLKLFFDAIDNSSRGSRASIRSDEARYLKDRINEWISNFKR